jgi:transmembrane sensor
MGKSRFIELMAKRIGKTATEKELAELEVFLDRFPEYRKMQKVTDALKSDLKQPDPATKQKDLSERIEELWYKIKNSDESPVIFTEKNNVRPIIYWRWAAAAILIFAAGGVFFYTSRQLQANRLTKVIVHHIYVPYGKTKGIVLPDGTKVKLNAGSSFSYPEVFSKTTREVNLEGEGFFEVTKNAKKPFLVHTSTLTVKVLGTVFNVKAYRNDKNIETTLLTGRVQVELKDKPEKNIILLPNEKLIVDNNLSGTLNAAAANTREARIEYQVTALPQVKAGDIKETAWLDNRIIFTNESFEEVAKQLERKYNVQMVFEEPSLKNEQISGVLENETLEQALQIIQMTTPFKFRIDGRAVHLVHIGNAIN